MEQVTERVIGRPRKERFSRMSNVLNRLRSKDERLYGGVVERLRKYKTDDLLGRLTVDTRASVKYLDFAKHIQINVARAKYLGLDKSEPRTVLDLGAGAGFFCYVASTYGHKAVALEHSTGYRPFLEFFDVPHVIQSIKPHRRIQTVGMPEQRFDGISAFAIMFNATRVKSYWLADDYLFLLNDLKENLLNPGGRVNFQFHGFLYGTRRQEDSEAKFRYYKALGKLLEPFVVDYHRSYGVQLDLFRPSAWQATRGVELPLLRRAEAKTRIRPVKKSAA